MPSVSFSPTDECWVVEISILHDSYPNEVSWVITRTAGGDLTEIAKSSEVYPEAVELSSTLDRACLPEGDYVLVMKDSFGDGIASPGNYNVTSYGNLVARGGGSDGFRNNETTAFSIPYVPQPSSSPSPTSTTPNPSPSQTLPNSPFPTNPSSSQSVPSTPFPFESVPSTPFPTESVCQSITAKKQCDKHHSGKCSWDLESELCVES